MGLDDFDASVVRCSRRCRLVGAGWGKCHGAWGKIHDRLSSLQLVTLMVLQYAAGMVWLVSVGYSWMHLAVAHSFSSFSCACEACVLFHGVMCRLEWRPRKYVAHSGGTPREVAAASGSRSNSQICMEERFSAHFSLAIFAPRSSRARGWNGGQGVGWTVLGRRSWIWFLVVTLLTLVS